MSYRPEGYLRTCVSPTVFPSVGEVFQVSTLCFVYAFDLSVTVLLLLDQIKPIGPLVPVN